MDHFELGNFNISDALQFTVAILFFSLVDFSETAALLQAASFFLAVEVLIPFNVNSTLKITYAYESTDHKYIN